MCQPSSESTSQTPTLLFCDVCGQERDPFFIGQRTFDWSQWFMEPRGTHKRTVFFCSDRAYCRTEAADSRQWRNGYMLLHNLEDPIHGNRLDEKQSSL